MNGVTTTAARAVAGGVLLGLLGAILGVIWGGATPWGMGSAALWLGVIGAVVGIGLGQEMFRGRASASLRRLTGGAALSLAAVGIVVWIITPLSAAMTHRRPRRRPPPQELSRRPRRAKPSEERLSPTPLVGAEAETQRWAVPHTQPSP